jgi:radical SAM superfamily enzyme YgiQ (UPF0313 family)
MKVVFIQSKVGFEGGHTWEALGIGYLVSYLKKSFPNQIEFDFFSGFYDSDETIIQGCKDAGVVGFSCTSPQFKHALDLANKIKTKVNKIVFGGVHPTVLSKQVFSSQSVDWVFVGEGERAIVRILSSPIREQSRFITSWELIEDLDKLPFPDRNVIKQERNILQAYKDERRRVASIFSSRGCPFKCTFCCSHSLWGRKVRYRSPGNILDEMDQLVRDWNIDFIKFSDDTFTVNRNRLLEFCREKVYRGLRVPFGANANVSTVDKDVLVSLVQAGCEELWFGVESGSPKILREMDKHISIDKAMEVFKLCRQLGVKTRAYFLLGMPSETIEDIKMTEELAEKLDPDIVGFSLLAPFPGNQYYNHELMKDWDWSVFDEYSNPWVHTKTLSNEELKSEQSRLVKKFKERITFRQKG